MIDNDNHLDGVANGEVRRPGARLLGNWSATIVGNTLAGELGANAPNLALSSLSALDNATMRQRLP